MRFLAIAFLLLSSATAADVPVYVNAGSMLCGAIRRVNQVQAWCWTEMPRTSATLGYNTILSFPTEGGEVIATYNFRANIITWKFTVTGDAMTYEVTANGGAIKDGSL